MLSTSGDIYCFMTVATLLEIPCLAFIFYTTCIPGDYIGRYFLAWGTSRGVAISFATLISTWVRCVVPVILDCIAFCCELGGAFRSRLRFLIFFSFASRSGLAN